MLAIVNPKGRVVPASSTLAGLDVIPAAVPRRVLRYEGDRGVNVQHLGPLVGPSAHRHIWPEVLDWAYSLWPSL